MSSRFIQIHTLTNYAATLLNRDDAGFAKRMPFGGAVRTRISSQCLKRHWRTYDGENSLATIEAPTSVRSRVAFDRYIVRPLIEKGVAETVAEAAAQKIVGVIFGSEAKQAKVAKKKSSKASAPYEGESVSHAVVATPQVTVLGRPELDYLFGIALQACTECGQDSAAVERALDGRLKAKDLKENLQALKPGSLEAGLGAALFGRMVTGDILARTDAAIHVAHAMTVHGQMTESDYFTAIDDLINDDGEQGSGHINASELTSGLFYGYVVVDVGGLVANLGGNRDLANQVVQRLVHMVATVSPGAKRGSTAPYAYSHLVLVEAGAAQPRTLQNAFIEPVRTTGNVIQNAYAAMASHLADLDSMYGASETRALAGLGTGTAFAELERKTLSDLAAWAGGRIA